jgi:TonB family protein
MSSAMLWNNLLAYSAQVLALVAAGALLPFLFRVRQPRAQLITCQLLLVASLVLPALQPWRRPLIVVPEAPTAAAAGASMLPSTPPAATRIRIEDAVMWVLTVGVAVRVLWLLVGLWRLRRYRLGATPLYPLPAAIESARAQTRAEAVVCVSAAVDSPVTFGFLPPVILLPPTLLKQPFEQQFAVASHEFLHVRRRDWLFTIGEELVGALVWFHPAVWWLQSQIRLAREQVVDRQVVALTEARDPYVSALLAMSGARLRLDLAPAPLFLRKRHLAQRIHSLLKEVSVSKRRLISSYASIAAILVLTAWLVAASFPLSGSPQVEVQQRAVVDQAGVSVQADGTLLHRTPVRYPAEAVKNRVEGVVVVSLSLNADGTVSDARILSGPEELRRTVLESVLQWHYLREASVPGTLQASIEFRLPEVQLSPAEPTVRKWKDKAEYDLYSGIVKEPNASEKLKLLLEWQRLYPGSEFTRERQSMLLRVYDSAGQGVVQPQTPPPPPAAPPAQTGINYARPTAPGAPGVFASLAPIGGFDVSALPEPLQSMVREKLSPFQGQQLSSDLLRELASTLSQVDSHLTSNGFHVGPGPNGTMTIMIRLRDDTASQSPPAPTTAAPATSFPSTPGVQRIPVGGGVQRARLISQPKPVYPSEARQARIQGLVRFDALIGTDGHVVNLQLVQGHPLLATAAQEAVNGCVYQPTLLNGQPVEVVTQIDVNFTLQ